MDLFPWLQTVAVCVRRCCWQGSDCPAHNQKLSLPSFLPSFRIHVKRQARKRVQKTIPLSCHLGDEMRKMGPTSPFPARTMSGDVARCSHVTVGPHVGLSLVPPTPALINTSRVPRLTISESEMMNTTSRDMILWDDRDYREMSIHSKGLVTLAWRVIRLATRFSGQRVESAR